MLFEEVETVVVINLVLWIVTAALWGIDKLMKKDAYKIAWKDCGQIICFIDSVVFIFSFVILGILLLLQIIMPQELLLIIFIPVMLFAFLGGVFWKYMNK